MSRKSMSRKMFKSEMDPDPKVRSLQQQLIRMDEELSMAKRQLGDEERFVDAVCQVARCFPAPTEAPQVRHSKDQAAHLPMEAVLIATDEHGEEIVESDEMEGLASYNWQTFMARSWLLVEKVIELVTIERQTSVVDKLHIWKLGDQATGGIHPDDNVGNTWELPEAVPNISDILAQQVAALSPHFPEIEVASVPGNHPRTTKRMAYKRTAERNWDRAITRIAQHQCRELSNVEWVIPKSTSVVRNVMGWDNYLTHGAEIPMNNRVPYYPIEATLQREAGMRRQARRWMEMAGVGELPDVEFDNAFMGHFHHRAMLSDNIYICPSLIGANQFAKSKVHSMSLPRQLLVFFTRRHGVTVERVINLMYAGSEHGFDDPSGE